MVQAPARFWTIPINPGDHGPLTNVSHRPSNATGEVLRLDKDYGDVVTTLDDGSAAAGEIKDVLEGSTCLLVLCRKAR